MRFEYDPAKSKRNKDRHGLGLAEAQALWESTHLVIPAKNVSGKNRSAIIGKLHGKIYVAIFTERGETIRLIRCHRGDKRWEKTYETFVRGEEK